MPPKKAAKSAPPPPPAKKAVKDAPPPPMRIPSAQDLKQLAAAELVQFRLWALSVQSRDYYDALSPEDQDKFDGLISDCYLYETKLRDAPIDVFARGAQEQMPRLAAAVTDVRRELDEARQTADLLKDLTSLITIIGPFL